MPDIVVHNAMGDKVLEKLDAEIRSNIDHEIFRFSVMGPDPFIFYRFYLPHFRHEVNKRSTEMHRTKTSLFLIDLAKRSESREMFSFTAGFLCHFAMDSVSHPFIYKLAENRGDRHTAIEHRLDIMELRRQGREPRDIMRLFTRFPNLPEVRKAMQEVYGWDDENYRISYRHMKLYHWIAKDQHGMLNRFIGWRGGKYSAVSFRTKAADELDLSPFEELEEQAVSFGVKLIGALYMYRAGRLSEKELQNVIGSRNYAGDEVEEFD